MCSDYVVEAHVHHPGRQARTDTPPSPETLMESQTQSLHARDWRLMAQPSIRKGIALISIGLPMSLGTFFSGSPIFLVAIGPIAAGIASIARAREIESVPALRNSWRGSPATRWKGLRSGVRIQGYGRAKRYRHGPMRLRLPRGRRCCPRFPIWSSRRVEFIAVPK